MTPRWLAKQLDFSYPYQCPAKSGPLPIGVAYPYQSCIEGFRTFLSERGGEEATLSVHINNIPILELEVRTEYRQRDGRQLLSLVMSGKVGCMIKGVGPMHG